MKKTGIAVKSLIIDKEGKILIIRREDNDPHKPRVWEFPGGRLKEGENPIDGLIRETKEETDLDIIVLNPLRTHYFTREDGQLIIMITYICRLVDDKKIDIRLSKEHTDFRWIGIDNILSELNKYFHDDIGIYKKFFHKKV